MDLRMSDNIFSPGVAPNTVVKANGEILAVPLGWELLPPGDALLTRRVKAAGEHWVVQEKRGRKLFSRGVWAATATIARLRVDVDVERGTESYLKRKVTDAKRREKVQAAYVEDFEGSVLAFLAFHADHQEVAKQMAHAITVHATPVGSGTVARTTRIPIEQRAEAAVIAWMRHQTTGYDAMQIARVKGERREVRRMLAQRSKQLLNNYRLGTAIKQDCPLRAALNRLEKS
jgi:hypothetical protein